MMTARIQDPEIGLDQAFNLGSLAITEHPITLIGRALSAAKAEGSNLELDPATYRIEKDETHGNTRTLTLNWDDGCDMPMTITFTDAPDALQTFVVTQRVVVNMTITIQASDEKAAQEQAAQYTQDAIEGLLEEKSKDEHTMLIGDLEVENTSTTEQK